MPSSGLWLIFDQRSCVAERSLNSMCVCGAMNSRIRPCNCRSKDVPEHHQGSTKENLEQRCLCYAMRNLAAVACLTRLNVSLDNVLAMLELT
jgi:hypothetical protein